MSDFMRPHRWQPTRLPSPWDSPSKNTRVGFHVLLQCLKVKSLSRVRLLVTPWTAAHQGPPSMGFSRQEYWSGVPLPSPGDLPDPGIEPRSSTLQADTLPSEPPGFFAFSPYSPFCVCRFCSDNPLSFLIFILAFWGFFFLC